MTNVIAPFEFDQLQFSRLTDDEKREVKRLVYMQPFQEAVCLLRQKYQITIPTGSVAINDVEVDQIQPIALRDDLQLLLLDLEHQPRKWLLFSFIFVQYGVITRPYRSHPTYETLPLIRKVSAQKVLPTLEDSPEGIRVPDQLFMRSFGELVDNNSTVAVRGGANHVSLFLTIEARREQAEAMLESAMQYLDALPNRKKGERNRGPDYDQLYAIAKLYRRGDTRPLDIQNKLFDQHIMQLRKQGWKMEDDSPEAEEMEQRFRDSITEHTIKQRIITAREQRFLL